MYQLNNEIDYRSWVFYNQNGLLGIAGCRKLPNKGLFVRPEDEYMFGYTFYRNKHNASDEYIQNNRKKETLATRITEYKNCRAYLGKPTPMCLSGKVFKMVLSNNYYKEFEAAFSLFNSHTRGPFHSANMRSSSMSFDCTEEQIEPLLKALETFSTDFEKYLVPMHPKQKTEETEELEK